MWGPFPLRPRFLTVVLLYLVDLNSLVFSLKPPLFSSFDFYYLVHSAAALLDTHLGGGSSFPKDTQGAFQLSIPIGLGE